MLVWSTFQTDLAKGFKNVGKMKISANLFWKINFQNFEGLSVCQLKEKRYRGEELLSNQFRIISKSQVWQTSHKTPGIDHHSLNIFINKSVAQNFPNACWVAQSYTYSEQMTLKSNNQNQSKMINTGRGGQQQNKILSPLFHEIGRICVSKGNG